MIVTVVPPLVIETAVGGKLQTENWIGCSGRRVVVAREVTACRRRRWTRTLASSSRYTSVLSSLRAWPSQVSTHRPPLKRGAAWLLLVEVHEVHRKKMALPSITQWTFLASF